MADDPRDASKEVPISKPLQWEETSGPSFSHSSASISVDEIVDLLSSFSILMSGASMITRNKYVDPIIIDDRWAPSLMYPRHPHRQIVWPALAIALTAYTSQRPIRMKEGGNGLSPLL